MLRRGLRKDGKAGKIARETGGDWIYEGGRV